MAEEMGTEVNFNVNTVRHGEHKEPEKKTKSKKKSKNDLRPVGYCVLSFFLAVILFLLTICVSLKVTLFSSEYMLQTMATKDYYQQVTEELRGQLDSLSHASGLSTEFTDSFVDSIDIREDIVRYVNSFYKGTSSVIDTTSFKQKYRAAIDAYIEENNEDGIEVKESAIEYLVNEAADIYSNSIEIPFFSVLANYVVKLSSPLTITMIVLVVIGAVLAAIMFLTNEFKHRGYRYLSYAFLSAAICNSVIAGIIMVTKVFSKVNITTRSLYHLFVAYFNGIFTYFWIFAGAFFVLGVIFFVLFAKKHRKLSRTQH